MDENKNVSNMETDEFAGESLHDSVKVLSPMRLVFKRFFRSRLSIVGLTIIVLLFLFSFVGPLFVPYAENQTFYIERTVKMSARETFTGADGETYELYDVTEGTATDKAPPSAEHPLGTDSNRMDVLVRLMYGGRVSLTLAFLVVFLETLLGVIFGGLAGFFGGWVDMVIMRVVDVFICLPGMPILLISSQLIKAIPSISADARIYWLMGILTVFGWSGTARLVRGQILYLREQEYMTAAEATGISSFSKIFRHLIPNVMPQLIVSMTLGLGSIILYESTLSYLGLGVQYPLAAWGSMISMASPANGGQEILSYYPNLWIAPGVLIVLAVLAFNFVGDGLRDAFDPKLNG